MPSIRNRSHEEALKGLKTFLAGNSEKVWSTYLFILIFRVLGNVGCRTAFQLSVKVQTRNYSYILELKRFYGDICRNISLYTITQSEIFLCKRCQQQFFEVVQN